MYENGERNEDLRLFMWNMILIKVTEIEVENLVLVQLVVSLELQYSGT